MDIKYKKATVVWTLLIAALILHTVLVVGYFANIKPANADGGQTGCFIGAINTVGAMIINAIPHRRCFGNPNNLGTYYCEESPMRGKAACQWPKPLVLTYAALAVLFFLYWYSYVIICRRIKAKHAWLKWTLGSIAAVLLFFIIAWLVMIFHVSYASCAGGCVSLG